METHPDPPPQLQEARSRIDRSLDVALEAVVARSREVHPDLAPLAEEILRFVSAGGKRLRPLLLTFGFEAAQGRGDVTGPALAAELVHTCALVHDDLIDRSGTRRGEPTAHRAFEQLVASDSDDPAAFGEAAAILAGDLAHVLADELFLDVEVPLEHLIEALRAFVTMREEVTGGQFLDVLAQHRGETSTALALTIAERKSGLYSVARPLQVGALLAGERELADDLVDFGLPLGVAFQLRDDVLGVFGSEDLTGKSTRSDLAEGKRTYLVAATLERLEGGDALRFRELLGRADLDEDGAHQLRETMRSSGGLEATEARARELLEESMRILDGLSLDPEVGEVLRWLARYLVERAS